MVGSEYSMDIHKSVKISIETVTKNSKILRFVPDYFKTERLRYVPNECRTQKLCDKAIKNGGT